MFQFFLWIIFIYIGNIKASCHRKLCIETWYSSKSFWILPIFFVWFFILKFSQYSQIKIYPRGQKVSIPPNWILLNIVKMASLQRDEKFLRKYEKCYLDEEK